MSHVKPWEVKLGGSLRSLCNGGGERPVAVRCSGLTVASASACGCCRARVLPFSKASMALLVDVCVQWGCKAVMHCRCGGHLAAFAAWGTLGFCASLVRIPRQTCHRKDVLTRLNTWLGDREDPNVAGALAKAHAYGVMAREGTCSTLWKGKVGASLLLMKLHTIAPTCHEPRAQTHSVLQLSDTRHSTMRAHIKSTHLRAVTLCKACYINKRPCMTCAMWLLVTGAKDIH